jgi:PHD/YefM family antitoxin component YafN of YafNO toxin-antitoxin module
MEGRPGVHTATIRELQSARHYKKDCIAVIRRVYQHLHLACIVLSLLIIKSRLGEECCMRTQRREEQIMKNVNALKVRNQLGEILDGLEETGEPVLISKGRKVRAVLITPEQFERRFLDYQTEEKKQKLLEMIASLKDRRIGEKGSVDVLRELRGYEA